MNQTTKKQHYIWRSYLAPWTNNNSNTGTIMCLRDNKIFPVSLMNIAHENYFYGIKKLSELERQLIYEITIKHTTGSQRKINLGWLDLYCAPFDLVDEMVRLSYTMGVPTDRDKIENQQEFRNWNIEYIEKFHGRIETTAMKYIMSIRQNDIGFWSNDKSRDEFSLFLCTQYFRTKRMRDALTKVFADAKKAYKEFNIHPENMWLPLSLIFSSNLGAHITNDCSAVLLQAQDSYFVVGDQPIINTHSAFSAFASPKDIELFYPITPDSALLLTDKPRYKNAQVLKIDADEVARYNKLEVKSSGELVFAKERAHLEMFGV